MGARDFCERQLETSRHGVLWGQWRNIIWGKDIEERWVINRLPGSMGGVPRVGTENIYFSDADVLISVLEDTGCIFQ